MQRITLSRHVAPLPVSPFQKELKTKYGRNNGTKDWPSPWVEKFFYGKSFQHLKGSRRIFLRDYNSIVSAMSESLVALMAGENTRAPLILGFLPDSDSRKN